MKTHNLMTVAVIAGICAGLSACGGSSGGRAMSQPSQPPQSPPMQPMPPTTTTLSVNDVLMKARVQSETDDPFEVNGGKVALTPTNDEESDPLSID